MKNPKYDWYQRGLASMVCSFFNKKSTGSGVAMLANKSAANNKIKQNLQIAKNYINQLLETLKKQQFIQDLTTIFGVLI